MSRKRDILALLTRDELVERVDAYGVEPEDRRRKDGLVD
jgi:hypothetical protein